jgi:hypothetical protein
MKGHFQGRIGFIGGSEETGPRTGGRSADCRNSSEMAKGGGAGGKRPTIGTASRPRRHSASSWGIASSRRNRNDCAARRHMHFADYGTRTPLLKTRSLNWRLAPVYPMNQVRIWSQAMTKRKIGIFFIVAIGVFAASRGTQVRRASAAPQPAAVIPSASEATLSTASQR